MLNAANLLFPIGQQDFPTYLFCHQLPAVYQYTKYGITTVEPTQYFANHLKYEFINLMRYLLLKIYTEGTKRNHLYWI